MTIPSASQENNPHYHSGNIKNMLQDVQRHAKGDVSKVQDPHAKALFEVTAEVLQGLVKAYEDYDRQSEKAWK